MEFSIIKFCLVSLVSPLVNEIIFSNEIAQSHLIWRPCSHTLLQFDLHIVKEENVDLLIT